MASRPFATIKPPLTTLIYSGSYGAYKPLKLNFVQAFGFICALVLDVSLTSTA